MDKNALYLEVDEDITSAIDKLKRTTGSSVNIVVPKRSTLLQSVINLKLLQKAAMQSGKDLVLVTNDRTATQLAGRVGLSVAETLGGKAARPEVAAPVVAETEEVIDGASEFANNAAIAEATAPVVPAVAKSMGLKKGGNVTKVPVIARRELTDGEDDQGDKLAAEAGVGAAAADIAASPAIKASHSAPKVPDFTKLQKRIMWLGGAVAAVIVYLVLMYYFTSAKITIYAAGTKVDVVANLVADPSLTKSDVASGALAAQQLKTEKDLSGTFVPTGTKDIGTKATGTITVYNGHGGSQGITLQAGTRFVAPDGNIFRSNSDVTVPPATIDYNLHVVPGSQSVAVTADQSGDTYNEAGGQSYSIPALNDSQVTAKGAQMSGGVTKTVKIVTQADIDKAKSDALVADKAGQKDLDAKAQSGYQIMTGSYTQTPGDVTATPGVGEIADQGSISFHEVDTELTVSKADFHDAVRSQEQQAIGKDLQLYDDGLAGATIAAGARESTGRQKFTVTATASGGPGIDTTSLAKSLAGHKYSDATDSIGKITGVQHSDISIWPSWQSTLPQRATKIKITINVQSSGG